MIGFSIGEKQSMTQVLARKSLDKAKQVALTAARQRDLAGNATDAASSVNTGLNSKCVCFRDGFEEIIEGFPPFLQPNVHLNRNATALMSKVSSSLSIPFETFFFLRITGLAVLPS